VWLGDYEKKSSARVFKNWRIGILDIPVGAVPLFGGDWGYSVDPAVLIKCYLIGERTLYITNEAYKIGVEIDDLPEFFASVPESKQYTSIADSSRPETISYMKRHGYPKMEPSVKGKDSVKEGIIFLQGYDIVVHPDCIHTIDELTLYSYKVDKLTEQVLPELVDDKNHVIDSIRYAVEKVRRKKKAGFVTW
jgi:phage terminase large subunit